MPIIIGGQVLNINDLKKEEPKLEVAPSDTNESEFKMTPPTKISRNKIPKIKDGNTLIVNGKQKTIGRKSQYLLDMMIIDDE